MKYIKITEQSLSLIEKDFKTYLQNLRAADGNISYSINLSKLLGHDIPKPTINISAIARMKMDYLVQSCSDEVGWHGTVTRDGNVYTVEDIIMYPQYVTATTVNTDDTEYAMWTMVLEDEVINKLRFQGHSHVNMSVSPSGVDTNFYDKLLQSLKGDDFYIFFIMNKRNDIFLNLYDLKQNIVFDTKDVTIQVLLPDGTPLETWGKTNKDSYILKRLIQTSLYPAAAQTIKTPEKLPTVHPKTTPQTKPMSQMTSEEFWEEFYKTNNYHFKEGITEPGQVIPMQEQSRKTKKNKKNKKNKGGKKNHELE